MQDPAVTPVAPTEYAPLWRRLAAGAYDLLPLAAILMIATALVFPITRAGIAPGTLWFQAYLVLVVFAYYGISWRRGGQTIGMRTWRLRAVADDGAALSWRQIMLRFAVALVSLGTLGAGFVAALFDPRRRTWHDVAAGTVVVVVPRGSSR